MVAFHDVVVHTTSKYMPVVIVEDVDNTELMNEIEQEEDELVTELI